MKHDLKNPFTLSLSKPVLSLPKGGRRPWFDRALLSKVEGLTTNGIFDVLTTNGIFDFLTTNGIFYGLTTNGIFDVLTTNGWSGIRRKA